MIVKGRGSQQLVLLFAMALAKVGAAAAQADQVPYPVSLTGCTDSWGDLTIPYPFGIGKSYATDLNCFLNEAFKLTYKGSTLYLGAFAVSNISLKGHVEVNLSVSSVCYDASGFQTSSRNTSFLGGSYTISSKMNKFFSVGCDTYGYLNSFQNGLYYSTGCVTSCSDGTNRENSESCSGIGCCRVEIPLGMKNISIIAYSFEAYKYVNKSINPCSYSFVHKSDGGGANYNFSVNDVNHGLPFENVPVVLDWAVETCTACGKNSHCNDTEYKYRCDCDDGFEGNPYHPDGCQDINECDENRKTSKHNCSGNQTCINKYGYFSCVCKNGDPTDEKECEKTQVEDQKDPKDSFIKAVVVAGAGFIAVLVGMSTTYLIYQKRKLIKLKEKFFRQNGGFILQQQLSTKEDYSRNTTKIFTAEELKKATNSYDESLIIGKGGYGTVFKGVLFDNRIVAIKKSKLADQSQVEQFINEVVVLSQINHRNVVKLFGCCLETEVPLLVYEYVNNGTLYDYIHNESKAGNISWETRLRIATEAAGALAYLHSAASIPIIHRDVKTANILLNENYRVKVSDFGASRLILTDHAEIATMVQGTIGYLDPEYMQSSQLTEKSDVYSFGVVLAELLTGEKALSFDRPEEKRSLSMYFLSAFKLGCLFEVLENGIVNEENKEEVMEVAALASKCLRLIGEERPSMKEVAMELEGIWKMTKHPWDGSNPELNLEETEYLLHEKSGLYERGDSSSHQNTGYDSIRDHELISLDDGR